MSGATLTKGEEAERDAVQRTQVAKIRAALRRRWAAIIGDLSQREEPHLECIAVLYAAFRLGPGEPELAAWIAGKIPGIVVKDLNDTWMPPGELLEVLDYLCNYLYHSDWDFKRDQSLPGGGEWVRRIGPT